MGARRKSEHHDAGVRIAEAGHGLSPIVQGKISPTLLHRDPSTITNETRTARAGNHLGVYDSKPLGIGHGGIVVACRLTRGIAMDIPWNKLRVTFSSNCAFYNGM